MESASGDHVRNLYIVNGLPPWPIRSWRKITGPRLSRLDHDRDREHRRQEQQQPERGGGPVDERLDDQVRPGEARRLDVQQRQPGDRPGQHPRPGHVGQTRGHHQLDVETLQRPAQLAQSAGAELPGRRAGDRVHTDARRDRGGVTLTAHDRHTRRCWPSCRRRSRRRPRCSRRPGWTGRRLDEPAEVRLVADHQHGSGQPAVAAVSGQPRAPELAGQQQCEGADREGHRDITAREVDVEDVGEDRDDREEAERAVEHLPVLLRPVTGDPPVVGVVDPQRHHPAEDQQQGDDGVVDFTELAGAGACQRHVGIAEPDDLRTDGGPSDNSHVRHHKRRRTRRRSRLWTDVLRAWGSRSITRRQAKPEQWSPRTQPRCLAAALTCRRNAPSAVASDDGSS